jgi:hypothetical protein
MKLLVIGFARHGKDTVCDILQNQYSYSFQSSSLFCADLFIYNTLKDKYNYSSIEECFNDRHNHRKEWYDLIREYNRPDPARLGKKLFESYDIYCGLRNKAEFHALKNSGSFNYSIWVDRSDHLPPESSDSISVAPWMADYIIDNNGSLKDLKFNVIALMTYLHQKEIAYHV